MTHTGMSIVIPTRDRGRLLHDAVASAYAASVPPLEVIIADDGSTDGSVEDVRRAYPQLRVVPGPFGNAARARNAGAAVALGDVLGFLDSDDLMAAGKSDALAERLRADPGLVVVHGTTEVIDENGAPNAELTQLHAARVAQGARLGLDYPGLAELCAMFTSATAIRRASFDQVGGYDETLDAYEDWDLYLRLSLIGRLAYTNDLAALYRVWPGNVEWSRTALWTIRVTEKHLSALPPLGEDEQGRARYGLYRRLAESHNVLGEEGSVRRATLAAARIAPARAISDGGLWRPLLRSLVPQRLLRRQRGEPKK